LQFVVQRSADAKHLAGRISGAEQAHRLFRPSFGQVDGCPADQGGHVCRPNVGGPTQIEAFAEEAGGLWDVAAVKCRLGGHH
jgi:hypothetical protein